MSNGWIGVDLDGTLAVYDSWQGYEHIGEPVPLMLERVKAWIAEGKDVRIFTARACEAAAIPFIWQWCQKHVGQILKVTNVKDYAMIELWDDRAIGINHNLGTIKDGEGRIRPIHE